MVPLPSLREPVHTALALLAIHAPCPSGAVMSVCCTLSSCQMLPGQPSLKFLPKISGGGFAPLLEAAPDSMLISPSCFRNVQRRLIPILGLKIYAAIHHWRMELRKASRSRFITSRSAPTAANCSPATIASWSAHNAGTTLVVRITIEQAIGRFRSNGQSVEVSRLQQNHSRCMSKPEKCSKGLRLLWFCSSPPPPNQAPADWASVREAWREAEPCAPVPSVPSQADRAVAPRCGDRMEA